MSACTIKHHPFSFIYLMYFSHSKYTSTGSFVAPYDILTKLHNQRHSIDQVGDSRSINLFDLRQGKDDLPPIPRPIIGLTGITFQIDRLQLRQDRQLTIECSKIGNLVSARLDISIKNMGGGMNIPRILEVQRGERYFQFLQFRYSQHLGLLI